MRISLPSVVTGTLGALAQKLIAGINALAFTEWPYTLGASFISNTALAAGTSVAVFSPAANVNGAIVWYVDYVSGSASAVLAALLAKSSAPASEIDGTCVAQVHATGGTIGATQRIVPLFIPAGQGLYFWSTNLESTNYKSVHYTLL